MTRVGPMSGAVGACLLRNAPRRRHRTFVGAAAPIECPAPLPVVLPSGPQVWSSRLEHSCHPD